MLSTSTSIPRNQFKTHYDSFIKSIKSQHLLHASQSGVLHHRNDANVHAHTKCVHQYVYNLTAILPIFGLLEDLRWVLLFSKMTFSFISDAGAIFNVYSDVEGGNKSDQFYSTEASLKGKMNRGRERE